jgi:hypothetical protein
MTRLYELKCLCGFIAGVRKGAAPRGKFYVFYGCPGCGKKTLQMKPTNKII